MYADLTDADQDRVVAALREVLTTTGVISPVLGSTVPTTRAGTPVAHVPSGTSLVTTEPAPITHRLPIVTPISTTLLAPMKVWSPIVTGARSVSTARSVTQRATVECV